MQSKWILKLPVIAALAFVICSSLLLTSPARAERSSEICRIGTLQGNYGYVATGVLLPAPNVSLEFRSIGMTYFDGNGQLNWVEHTVVGGVSLRPGWTVASGTYTVNANCTGTAVVNTPNSPVPLNLSFVITRDGKQMNSVLDANAILTQFTKVDD